ncbi:MAG TPA: hypothetical protein PK264_13200 [Hyphomicrobiaceae bacterium]|nr:hypothetical protein [Hyphomicrobiaceae bacterium]
MKAIAGLAVAGALLAMGVTTASAAPLARTEPAVTSSTPNIERVHGWHRSCQWGPIRRWWHRHTSYGPQACRPYRRGYGY